MCSWFSYLRFTAARRCFWRWRYLLTGALLGSLLLLAGFHSWYVCFGGNFHTVIPGTVYRSAQPDREDLNRLVTKYQIRTVINLRGDNGDVPWYRKELAVSRSLGVRMVDVGIWAKQPPSAEQFRRLVEALTDSPGAMLIHCSGGSDRTGLAAALAVLLHSDATVAEARRQLSVYYGHNPFGAASCHDRVLDAYQYWLTQRSLPHSSECLRAWASTDYAPEEQSGKVALFQQMLAIDRVR